MIGSHTFIEGFEEGLYGTKVGDTVTLDLAFPEPYDINPDLAGQPVQFVITVLSKVVPVPAEYNEEFIKSNSNDAATAVHEVIDFAESVELALAFYRQHPNETLIVITADHETGGLTMGSGQYAMKPEVLASQKISKEALAAKIADLRRSKKDNVSWNDIKELFKAELGFWDTIPVSKRQEMIFTDVYKTTILDNSATMDENLYSRNDMLTKAAIDFVNKSAMTTFSFGSHSGAPVPVFAIGAKADSFKDCRDNTDLPKTILKVTRWK